MAVQMTKRVAALGMNQINRNEQNWLSFTNYYFNLLTTTTLLKTGFNLLTTNSRKIHFHHTLGLREMLHKRSP